MRVGHPEFWSGVDKLLLINLCTGDMPCFIAVTKCLDVGYEDATRLALHFRSQ